MAVYLSKEKIAEIFEKHGGGVNNTGSVEGQVALFSFRIANMTEHLKVNRKDFATRRSLLKLVGKRKSLLKYLAKKDVLKYRQLIADLGIRDVLRK